MAEEKDPFETAGVRAAMTVLESHGWQITTHWTGGDFYAIYFRRRPKPRAKRKLNPIGAALRRRHTLTED